MTERVMLDTSVLLWALTDPTRLSTTSATLLADRRTHLVTSAASAWEIATKQRLGKLPQADAIVRGFARHLDRLGAENLAITMEHALLAGSLDWAHRDPFDRMIAAQCMSEALPLVTSDQALRSLSGVRLIW